MEALLPIEGKGFEAKAFKEWLALTTREGVCAGCLLTADALHTQTAVCKAIRKAGADYLLVAKRNQRSLREDIGYLFSQTPDFWFPERQAKSVTVGHGRIEVRLLRASDELNDYLADRWPGVAQVFQVERTVIRRSRQGTQTTVERVYGLTSLPAERASPAQLLTWLRAHWHIENRNHWRRDATLGEDRLQLSCKPAARVMAVLNCLILALFDYIHCTNCRQAMRTFAAHPDRALALLRQTPDF
jgi:predicted transposase YbfD/YdcC